MSTTVHRVRHGGEEYRVVKAGPRSGRAVMYDKEWSLDMYVDRRAAAGLAVAWGLAARSRRSLVYVPLKADREGPKGLDDRHRSPVALDLVLAHHSLGFPPSRWKAVRGRLGPGKPHTVEIPENEFSWEEQFDHGRRLFRGWRDELRFDLAAHTLFLTGSATAFRLSGALLHSLTTDGPARALEYPGTHECVTLEPDGTSGEWPPRGGPGQVHIQYAHGWRAA
ncbi:hypothetical protein [Kitasatospora sp. NPDC057500]|uniref:hypothetical protein n=1 Tax=Kitasatospora sp. NPDC057500 TaxID=3346151 RepID=UPI00369F97E3